MHAPSQSNPPMHAHKLRHISMHLHARMPVHARTHTHTHTHTNTHMKNLQELLNWVSLQIQLYDGNGTTRAKHETQLSTQLCTGRKRSVEATQPKLPSLVAYCPSNTVYPREQFAKKLFCAATMQIKLAISSIRGILMLAPQAPVKSQYCQVSGMAATRMPILSPMTPLGFEPWVSHAPRRHLNH